MTKKTRKPKTTRGLRRIFPKLACAAIFKMQPQLQKRDYHRGGRRLKKPERRNAWPRRSAFESTGSHWEGRRNARGAAIRHAANTGAGRDRRTPVRYAWAHSVRPWCESFL